MKVGWKRICNVQINIQLVIKPVHNSRFKQLRVLWEVHFCVPQNFLSLTENNQFRISQLREAANVKGN